ncbi:MAG: SDR family oxidoreductase [Bacteroidetes bacterium]|nr:MAG: SDR family oxidoreductase [Bacteroidota bacterium]
MNLDLNGKTALVGGSTQGIGWASACELASMGARVVLIARNEEKLRARVSELPQVSSVSHDYIVADYTEPQVVAKNVQSWLEANGPIQILINNTGGPAAGPAHLADAQDYVAAFNLHLVNNQNLVQLLLPGMKESGYGRVVNVISTSVKIPLNGLGVSNTIRGAVANWSKTLANELGAFGITVNNVLPGATETERLTSIISNKSAKTGKSEAEVVAAMTGEVPMKRFAKPGEVANAVAFLASPAASYINGINIPVDGGRTGSL